MRITCTNGNARNGISGSRVTVRADSGAVVDVIHVPARNGPRYCEMHPGGRYGKRYAEALEKARGMERST